MLTKEEARTIALAVIAESARKGNRDFVLLEHAIVEKPYAWVFPFNTRAYAETQDRQAMVIGLGPVVVNRQSGVAQVAPARPIEHFLAYYESTLPTASTEDSAAA